MKRLVFIFILFIAQSYVYAKTYYVKSSGNNNNSGTNWSSAWQTINHAGSNANMGDTVIISNGIYNESVSIKSNGSLNNPIVFQAYDNNNVIIDGSGYSFCFALTNNQYIQIHGFILKNATNSGIGLFGVSQFNIITSNTICSNTAYGIILSGDEVNNNLLLGNHVIGNQIGIMIDNGDYNTVNRSFIHNNNSNGIAITGDTFNTAGFNYISRNIIYSNANGITLYSRYNYIYTNQFYHNSANGISCSTASYSSFISNQIYKNDDGFFLGNGSNNEIHKNVIYSNSVQGIYFTVFTSTLALNTIKYNHIYRNIYGVSAGKNVWRLTIEYNRIHHNYYGLNHTGSALPSSSRGIYFYVNYNSIYSNTCAGIRIGDYVTNLSFQHNEIYGETQTNGIKISGNSPVTLKYNKIYNNLKNGIYITGGNSDKHSILNNEIYGPLQAKGIYINDGDRQTIQNNIIYNNAQEGIYLVNSDNTSIFQNSIYQNNTYGINVNQSTSIRIINNTIHKNKTEDGIFFQNNGSGEVINCIISENGDGIGDFGIENSSGGTIYVAYNDLYNNTDKATNGTLSMGTGNTNVDPHLDPSSSFRILTGFSPVIDIASNVDGVTTTISGSGPDMGWKEYAFNDTSKPTISINKTKTAYMGSQDVLISASDPEAGIEYICYTLDNSDPLISSTCIISETDSVSLLIEEPTTIICYAMNRQKIRSEVLEKYIDIFKPTDKAVIVYNNSFKPKDDFARIVFGKNLNVNVKIFSINGLLVKEFPKQYYMAGDSVNWYGTYLDSNDSVNSGIYFVSISGDITKNKIVIIER